MKLLIMLISFRLMTTHLMLEPEIASLTAKYASEEEAQQIKKLCDETEHLYLNGSNHIPKDIEFHTCIARGSKNRVIETLIPIINTAVMTFANMTSRTLMRETIETHRAVVNAILDKDPMGAKCAMVMHLTYNRQALIKQSKESFKEKKDI